MSDAHQTYQHILFCTDFSENAAFAFGFALDAASRRADCVLHILHVIPEPEAQFWKTYLYEVEGIDAKARADIDAKIEADYMNRLPPRQNVDVQVRIGKDYVEILKFAREQAVDLVVMGRQGHTAFEKVLFGNVTEKVARKSACPVLIVPMSYRARQEPPRD